MIELKMPTTLGCLVKLLSSTFYLIRSFWSNHRIEADPWLQLCHCFHTFCPFICKWCCPKVKLLHVFCQSLLDLCLNLFVSGGQVSLLRSISSTIVLSSDFGLTVKPGKT